MDNGIVNGVIIILLIISFAGLTMWAYSKRRKPDFDEAANLPFADDDEPPHRDQNASREADSRHDKGERNT